MNTFFSIFGKLVLILLVVGALVGGGYYLGKKYNLPLLTTTPITTVVPSSVSPTITQQQTPSGRFVVNAGGASATSFANTRYTLSAISGWSLAKTEQPGISKVVLTKDAYQLSIYQAAVGGGGCIFPGDQPQSMSIVLTAPVAEIPLLDGTLLKRGQTDSSNTPGKLVYDVCQKGQGNSYGNLTYFGVINYTVPLNPDSETIAEMDAMVGSLQKQ